MKIGIVMDPIQGITVKKDSSLAMLLAAQLRGWQLYYMELGDLFTISSTAMATIRPLEVKDNDKEWYLLQETETVPLSELDIILMRKDPPFDLNYIHATYILEHARRDGVLVVNNPSALREVNEKFFITHFPDCIAPTLVSQHKDVLLSFIGEQQDCIVKPLDAMAGQGVFRIRQHDPNKNAILETLSDNGNMYVMAQRYLPEIKQGDKRILLINGEPIPYALARIPARGETRGNLARGGSGQGVELSGRDRWICKQVGPRLTQMGLVFVGLDVIGDYLTEINVTSPTCIRELDSLYNLNIGSILMAALEKIQQTQYAN